MPELLPRDSIASCPCTDPFEIHVYEYEPQDWGDYSLEAHLNFDPQGTSTAQGTLLPMDNQTHLTLEPTIGLAPEVALGFISERMGTRQLA